MKHHAVMSRSPHQAGFEPGPSGLKSGVLTTRPNGRFHGEDEEILQISDNVCVVLGQRLISKACGGKQLNIWAQLFKTYDVVSKGIV